MKAVSTIFIALLLSISHALAQNVEVWSWEKCIEYALENNTQLQMDAIQIELSSLQLQQDKLNLTPFISGDASYTYAIGRTVDMSTYQYVTKPVNTGNLQISLSQPIFEGLRNIHTLKKSKLDLQAAKLDHETLKQNILLQIMNAYLNILNAQEQLDQAHEQLAISKTQYEYNENLVRHGAMAERLLVDSEVQLSSDEYNVQVFKQQLQLAYMALKTILRIDQKRNIQIETPQIAEELKTFELDAVEYIYQNALTHRPEIKSASNKLQSSKLGVKAARSSYYPSLSFFSGVGTNLSDQITETKSTTFQETPIGYVKTSGDEVYTIIPTPVMSPMKFGKQFSNNISYALGLSLSIPIYNRRAGHLNTERAKLAMLQSQINQEDISYNLYNDIQEAYIQASTSEQNYLAAQKNLTASQKSFEFAQERLRNGAIGQLELNLAQNNLQLAKSRLSQAKYDYIFNVKILDYYSGKPIELN